ncbi:MAG TPA: Gfo/Idh/MocA family oxidoreductase [Hypericibacter adhaerens]|uniref:Oxidoreductase n=1 Tax=Hypericibacter adhaerens TaxID=2602016 RepID=A0A5J6N0F6_9PROT|nr:Gfo/Idh/MocA family oxidoreductase [Hypericibacter adhaerens]QEX22415.1 oxidoreductase [Hypericibacter adhaerens]HWA45947.1 Gfo/Idh/MocA family oxidoreductase [Hypericibacter adhaerens]
MLSVGLIGYGHWGPNLLRNLVAHPAFHVAAVADPSAARRLASREAGHDGALYEDGAALIRDHACLDAVVIASPVSTHYDLARATLERGAHVLVEKPLCTRSSEGEALVALARRQNRVLMVDHTLLFTGPGDAIRQLVRQGRLGRITYCEGQRLNLGLFQPDVNVLWDLAPHDLSLLTELQDELPVRVDAVGQCHVNPGVPDIVHASLRFASGWTAHFHWSWMSPEKVRRLVIGGSDRMLVWDDLASDGRLKLYDRGIAVPGSAKAGTMIRPAYRTGGWEALPMAEGEALARLVDHFAAVIESNADSVADGARGLRVVKLLEQIQFALDRSAATTKKPS